MSELEGRYGCTKCGNLFKLDRSLPIPVSVCTKCRAKEDLKMDLLLDPSLKKELNIGKKDANKKS